MAAKKMPAKKMPAKNPPAQGATKRAVIAKVEKMSAKQDKTAAGFAKLNRVESSIKKRYGAFNPSDFKGYEKDRKGFQSMFADVVSEGPMGQNNTYMRAAEKIAAAAWDKKFGKKKK